MNRIPILATVSRAYGFLIAEFMTILRLVWAPFLAAAALQYVYGPAILDAATRTLQSSDRTFMMAHAPEQFLLALAAFMANIMALVVLLRLVILSDRKPGLFVYFWFGGAELRLAAAIILLSVAVVAAAIGLGIVFGVLTVIAAQVPVAGILVLLACIGVIVAAVWAAMRLTLIPAVITAEGGLGVERSWYLMRGNALRMFFILLVVFVPVSIVSSIAASLILGSDTPTFPDVFAMWQGANRDMSAFFEQFQKAMTQYQVALARAQIKHWPELIVFAFVSSVISTALTAGVGGSAYLSATGKSG